MNAARVSFTAGPSTWRDGPESDLPPGRTLFLASCSATQEVNATQFRTMFLSLPSGRPVRLPLPIDVRCAPGYWAVTEPLTGIHGVGGTETEAIRDFWQALSDFDAATTGGQARNVRALRSVIDRLLSL